MSDGGLVMTLWPFRKLIYTFCVLRRMTQFEAPFACLLNDALSTREQTSISQLITYLPSCYSFFLIVSLERAKMKSFVTKAPNGLDVQICWNKTSLHEPESRGKKNNEKISLCGSNFSRQPGPQQEISLLVASITRYVFVKHNSKRKRSKLKPEINLTSNWARHR